MHHQANRQTNYIGWNTVKDWKIFDNWNDIFSNIWYINTVIFPYLFLQWHSFESIFIDAFLIKLLIFTTEFLSPLVWDITIDLVCCVKYNHDATIDNLQIHSSRYKRKIKSHCVLHRNTYWVMSKQPLHASHWWVWITV